MRDVRVTFAAITVGIALLVGTPACSGKKCTFASTICNGTISVIATDALKSLGARSSVTAEFCIDNLACTTYTLIKTDAGWTCHAEASPTAALCGFSGGNLSMTLELANILSETATYPIEVDFSDAAGSFLHRSGTIEVVADWPSGKDCGTVCDAGSSTVAI